MSILVVCRSCGQQFTAPDALAGRQEWCARCGAAIAIPSQPAATADDGPEYAIERLPHEQWFVTMPDGRQYGPVTQAQFDAAVAQGRIPPVAEVRRGDWPQRIPLNSLIARQQAAVNAAKQRAAMPYGTYSEQFARNPIGTLLAGPQMPVHQASRDPAVLAHRRTVFLRWVYFLLAMLGAAIALPLVAGILRLEPAEGALGAGVALFFSFWPVVFYLIGMLMFAGAHFEWSWFMNSKRMRSMRAGGGDASARNAYRWMGGIMMGLSGMASVVMTLGIAGFTVAGLFDLDKMQAEHNAQRARENLSDEEFRKLPDFQESRSRSRRREDQPAASEGGTIGTASASPDSSSHRPAATETPNGGPSLTPIEAVVLSKRQQLEQALAQLDQQLLLIQQTEDRLEREKGNLQLLEEFTEQVKRAGGLRSNVAVGRLQYQNALEALANLVASRQVRSDTLDNERRHPPVSDPPLLAAESSARKPFPRQEIDQLEREIDDCESQLRGIQQFCQTRQLTEQASFQYGVTVRRGTQLDLMNFLAGEIDGKRGRLTEIQSQWGYRSRHLSERPAKERVAEYIAAHQADARHRAELELPPHVPVPPSMKMRTFAELEDAYRRLKENLARSRQSAASARQSAEFFRKNVAGEPEKVAFFQKVADDAQQRLDRLIDAEKGLRKELEEACRREGKTSELLNEPPAE